MTIFYFPNYIIFRRMLASSLKIFLIKYLQVFTLEQKFRVWKCDTSHEEVFSGTSASGAIFLSTFQTMTILRWWWKSRESRTLLLCLTDFLTRNTLPLFVRLSKSYCLSMNIPIHIIIYYKCRQILCIHIIILYDSINGVLNVFFGKLLLHNSYSYG